MTQRADEHPSRPNVRKPDWLRIAELEWSLLVVRDSVEGLANGQRHMALPLSAQLRALLLEKRRGNAPLLLSLSREAGVELSLFIGPAVSPDASREGMLIDIGGVPISSERLSTDQIEVPIAKALDHLVLRIGADLFTIGQLIKIGAEKAGGAHHPEVVPARVARLLTFRQLGLQPLTMLLVAVGRAVLRLGRLLLASLCDLDLHLIAVFRAERTAVLCLFDAYDPETEARIRLLLDPIGHLTASVVSVDGMTWQVTSETIVTNETRCHLYVGMRLSTLMGTEVTIAINGQSAGRFTLQIPTVLSGFQQDYEVRFNAARDNTTLTGHFALGSVQLSPAGVDLTADAARFLEHATGTSATDERYLLFEPGDTLRFGTLASRRPTSLDGTPDTTGQDSNEPLYPQTLDQVVAAWR